ncbi:hypothetical protein GCM10028792_39990 [Salinisphaera aquimarina]
MDAAVSLSELSATTSGTHVTAAPNTSDNDVTTGANRTGGSAFANAAGITQYSQNSGIGSTVQQSVSMQADVAR